MIQTRSNFYIMHILKFDLLIVAFLNETKRGFESINYYE